MIIINLQKTYNTLYYIPKKKDIKKWLKLVFTDKKKIYHFSIRIVKKYEIQKLNLFYRKKNKPTNVLSFTLNYTLNKNIIFLGDIIICGEIVYEESISQKKLLQSHWAHMIIHSSLHLKGYNHIFKNQAKKMEHLEIKLMQSLGYSNPYLID